MRYLTFGEVVSLHNAIITRSGGGARIRDLAALDSALAQPKSSFDGEDLYPAIVDKAAALAFSLAQNHPFIDGNKRIAHAAMEAFLVLNGFEITAGVDEQERVMLSLASGRETRESLTDWLKAHIRALR